MMNGTRPATENWQTRYATQLMNIRRTRYSPSMLFRASPYSDTFSLGRNMSRGLFNEALHHDPLEVEDMRRQFMYELERNDKRVVVLSGHSGSGKTTFLQQFRERYEQRCSHYFFDASISRISDGRRDPLAYQLRRSIKKDFSKSQQASVALLLRDQHEALEDHLSERLFSQLRRTEASQYTREWMLELLSDEVDSLTDMIVLFLLCHMVTRDDRSGLQIFYFDNLDAIEVDYFSGEFQESLLTAMNCATSMALDTDIVGGDSVLFVERYRFVFCLREANSAFLRAHFDSQNGDAILYIPMRLRFRSDYYRDIIRKRIAFMKIVSRDEAELALVEDVFEHFMDDDFFEDVCMKLFNYDYRDVATALYNLCARISTGTGVPVPHLSGTATSRYASRAILHGALIRYLESNGVLDAYADVAHLTDRDFETHGYCHHLRVVLNLVSNLAMIDRYDFEINSKRIASYTNLLSLFESLQSVYSPEELVMTLERAFLFHTRNWANLLGIYGHPVSKPGDLVPFAEDMRKLNRLRADLNFTIDSETHAEVIELEGRLREVVVRMCPAGIATLEHVFPSFEFYSRLHARRLDDFDPPTLFEARANQDLEYRLGQGRRRVDREPVAIINCVLYIVRKHVRWMLTFFDVEYRRRLGLDGSAYITSHHCNRIRDGKVRREGQFHASRLIFSHVSYIDVYRRWALEHSDLEGDAKIELNKALVSRIEAYLELVRDVPDERALWIADGIERTIAEIRDKDFSDFVTRIERPHD